MTFLKVTDFKKALDIYRASKPPRQFMLDMEGEHGFAYWVSGVLYWLCKQEANGGVDLNRYLKVQKKVRLLGYCIIEEIPERWEIVRGQMDLSFNSDYEVFTDLRHARFIDDDFDDWTRKEIAICKKAAKKYLRSGGGDLTRWCRAPAQKKLKLRECQLLVGHFAEGG